MKHQTTSTFVADNDNKIKVFLDYLNEDKDFKVIFTDDSFAKYEELIKDYNEEIAKKILQEEFEEEEFIRTCN